MNYCWPTYFKVLEVLFLGGVSSAFLPCKKAYYAHKFRHVGVGQQYPLVFCECLQVIIHKDDTVLAYEISPMYRGSPYEKSPYPEQAETALLQKSVLLSLCYRRSVYTKVLSTKRLQP